MGNIGIGPRIVELPKRKLVGKSIRMSLAKNKTETLWRSFMTEKATLKNTMGTDLYSIQVYDDMYHSNTFNPETEFTKWAAIEVENHNNIPNGFLKFDLEAGLYAVFVHKGPPSSFAKTMQYIFSEWLPTSGYKFDDRPYFELLGAKYKNNDPNSEEEIWIPIQKNQN